MAAPLLYPDSEKQQSAFTSGYEKARKLELPGKKLHTAHNPYQHGSVGSLQHAAYEHGWIKAHSILGRITHRE